MVPRGGLLKAAVDKIQSFCSVFVYFWGRTEFGVGGKQKRVEKRTLAAASTAFCRENLAKYSAVAASVNPINT